MCDSPLDFNQFASDEDQSSRCAFTGCVTAYKAQLSDDHLLQLWSSSVLRKLDCKNTSLGSTRGLIIYVESTAMDLRTVDKTISVLVWLIATIIGFN